MTRSTVDFGIDLGTTNSAVAVLKGTITDIIKNNRDNDITPSAVYINKHGQIHTGLLAKNRLEDERSANDAYVEFKRRMGTSYNYEFQLAAQAMSPEQLSAEVLKGLRGDVQQRLGEDIRSAVITVPAAFEQKQCAATRIAGELAGIYHCPLVQEPVAAALAYGYQADVTKEYWLIFDFGGGTFDAAVMKAEDGTIAVVNHGGDNYLGGSDMDWSVVEQLIIPAIRDEFNLPDLRRGNKEWKTALAVVKRAVEVAKIQLSRSDTAYLEDCRIRDADGKEIEIEYKLSRDTFVSVVEPLIMRAVGISGRVLKEKNLTSNAIEKMVLVGGPTLAPYFREILEANLGIALDYSVDPLTVVARGAAVFAGTQRIEGKFAPKASVGQYDLDLIYEPIGGDEDPSVRGTVKAPAGQSVDGCTIEFLNQQTHWRSGKVPIKENGRFRVDLRAEKGEKNDFAIDLRDAKGTRQVCVPNSMSYTIGFSISEQPISISIAVALANNESDVFFRKGDPLPAKATRVYRSTHAVRKGSEDHLLNVPVVQGEVDLADRNRLLGKLTISGAQVRRDVLAGSEVEVTLHIDASGLIRAKAYIPVLDEEFEEIIDILKASPDSAHLQISYEAELSRLEELRDKAEHAGDSDADCGLEEIDVSDETEVIARMLDSASVDPDVANNAERRLLELKVALDRVENSLKWPALVAYAGNALDDVDDLVTQHAPEYRHRLEELREQVDELIAQKRPEALQRKMEQIADLHREVLHEQPGFWLGFFNYLVEARATMHDQAAADRLINQGLQCIQRDNIPGLRNAVAQLLGLIPQQEAEAIQRGYQSSLLK
jgi:molecular chaperone DnaK